MPFASLGLHEPLLTAIVKAGYTQPTPIQEQAIASVLDGRDVLGCAQTGTGKTAAFSLPILQRLIESPSPHKKQTNSPNRPIRCLILSPTRELAGQIGENIETYAAGSGLKHVVIYGGVKQHPQTKALREGVDIVVATPGRLIDLMEQGHVKLGSIETLVLDEADRMLDMGFIEDIWRILSYMPKDRQSLLFSATMPTRIASLAAAMLHDPVSIHIAPKMPAAESIEQRLYLVEWGDKTKLLKHLLQHEDVTRALVFVETKRRADVVVAELQSAGLGADVIHSDRPQHARQRALENFKSGKKPLLVASDIAARGLDVTNISHVINYELPSESEVYVHRIGRTGRAEAKGVSMSFCCADERTRLDDIEKLLGDPIPLIEDQPYPSFLPRKKAKVAEVEDPRKTTGVRSNRRPSRRRRL